MTGPRATSTPAPANAAGVPKSAIKRAHFSFEGFDEHYQKVDPPANPHFRQVIRTPCAGKFVVFGGQKAAA